MRYMIHAMPKRLWYVEDFIVPSMLEQGIPKDEIVIYCDDKRKGNLFSYMDSMRWCGEHPTDGTWHIQDDALLSKKFAERTRKFNEGVVCGAVMKEWGPDYLKTGIQPVKELWFSFLCIRIPDELAAEVAYWFYMIASKRNEAKYLTRIRGGKNDDDFFQFFLFEKYPDMKIMNLKPCLVDHVDFMVGGSLVNGDRKKKINRVAYWEDEDLIQKLSDDLLDYTNGKLKK